MRNHSQNRKRTIRIQTELDKERKVALPNAIQPAGSEPPSVGRMRSAAPERIDQVASVTRKGCRRSTEMIRPLAIPTRRPIARIASPHAVAVVHDVAELRRRDHRAEADHAADREIDAAAEEHDGLAGRGKEERHRRGRVEVQLLQAEDVVAERSVDRDEHRPA